MSQFTVSGRFRTRNGWQSFERGVDAPNEGVAADRIYSRFGSEHGLKRTHVEIEVVES